MWYRIAIFFVRLARTGEFSLPGIGNYINYTLTVDKFKNPALIFKKLGWVKKNPHTKFGVGALLWIREEVIPRLPVRVGSCLGPFRALRCSGAGCHDDELRAFGSFQTACLER